MTSRMRQCSLCGSRMDFCQKLWRQHSDLISITTFSLRICVISLCCIGRKKVQAQNLASLHKLLQFKNEERGRINRGDLRLFLACSVAIKIPFEMHAVYPLNNDFMHIFPLDEWAACKTCLKKPLPEYIYGNLQKYLGLSTKKAAKLQNCTKTW